MADDANANWYTRGLRPSAMPVTKPAAAAAPTPAPAPAVVVAAPVPAPAPVTIATPVAAPAVGPRPGAWWVNPSGARRWVSHSSFPRADGETLYTIEGSYTSGDNGGTTQTYIPFTYSDAVGLKTSTAYYRQTTTAGLRGNPNNWGDVMPAYEALWYVMDDFSLRDPNTDTVFTVAAIAAASVVTAGVASWAAAGAGVLDAAAAPTLGNGAFLGEGIASGVPAWDAAAVNAGLTLAAPAAVTAVAAPAAAPVAQPLTDGAFLGEGVDSGIASWDTALTNAAANSAAVAPVAEVVAAPVAAPAVAAPAFAAPVVDAAPAIGNGAFLGEGVASGVPAWDAAAVNAGLTLTAPAAVISAVTPPAATTPGLSDGAFLGEGVSSGVPAWDAAAVNAGVALTAPPVLGTTVGQVLSQVNAAIGTAKDVIGKVGAIAGAVTGAGKGPTSSGPNPGAAVNTQQIKGIGALLVLGGIVLLVYFAAEA